VTGPLVPLSIITDRVRGAAYLGAAVATFGVLGTFLLGTYYLQGVLGFTPLVAGLAFLPFLGGVAIAANVVSNVGLARLGPKVVVPAGLLVAAAGAGWLTRISTHGSYAAVVVPGFVLLGLGAGAAVATAFSLGPAGARPADAGVAAALVNASNQVGGSIGAALLNTIAASVTAAYLAGHAAGQDPLAATVHGDVAAFTFLVALFAAGAVTTGLLYPRKASVAVRRPSSGGAISPTPSASAG
jgi:Major Facilitator Superfamily